MTLSALEIKFNRLIIHLLKLDLKGTEIEICSGGVKKSGEGYPLLCISEESAAQYWFEAASKLIKSRKPKLARIVESPKVEKFQITIADWRQMQRIADARYVVTSRIILE